MATTVKETLFPIWLAVYPTNYGFLVRQPKSSRTLAAGSLAVLRPMDSGKLVSEQWLSVPPSLTGLAKLLKLKVKVSGSRYFSWVFLILCMLFFIYWTNFICPIDKPGRLHIDYGISECWSWDTSGITRFCYPSSISGIRQAAFSVLKAVSSAFRICRKILSNLTCPH